MSRNKKRNLGIFDMINPFDFRYYSRNKEVLEKCAPFLSEEGMIRHMTEVEIAVVKELEVEGIALKGSANDAERAASHVTASEVYEEEDRIKHNVRALVNVMRRNMNEKNARFVHLGVTSHDIICTADSLRYRRFVSHALVPELRKLEKLLIAIALREKSTLQIGRTHGQHAEPLTFGFALSEYVSRLGGRIMRINEAASNLVGKISGAVGAYNASSLLLKDPVLFERRVLRRLSLKPATHSTQIAEPEHLLDLIHAVISALGVLANLADDMRHLQRTEIAEVKEEFLSEQVGSSTMPHKRNPINFENVKSMFKAISPRIVTYYLDQISEHQRDLTNSASSRFIPEIFASLFASSVRLRRVLSRLRVDAPSLKSNFNRSRDMIRAEPLYILLSYYGYPDAHEKVRQLTLISEKSGRSFLEAVKGDKELRRYLMKFTDDQMKILENPEYYTGMAEKKTASVCSFWSHQLKL